MLDKLSLQIIVGQIIDPILRDAVVVSDAADAAVITDARAPEATYAAVCAAHPDLPVLAPALLHITRRTAAPEGAS